MTKNLTRLNRTGLCFTCVHALSCVFLDRAKSPVWQCEEFDDRGDAPEPIIAPFPVVAHPKPAPTVGLCGNCDHYETCSLPKAEGGVWYCEEYA